MCSFLADLSPPRPLPSVPTLLPILCLAAIHSHLLRALSGGAAAREEVSGNFAPLNAEDLELAKAKHKALAKASDEKAVKVTALVTEHDKLDVLTAEQVEEMLELQDELGTMQRELGNLCKVRSTHCLLTHWPWCTRDGW
jgi:hypothetical protein